MMFRLPEGGPSLKCALHFLYGPSGLRSAWRVPKDPLTSNKFMICQDFWGIVQR